MTEAPSKPSAAALLDVALSKSGLLWIRVPDGRSWPAWHVWLDGAAYVVNGPGEQTLPWLPERVELIVRSKDSGARLLRVPARAEVVTPEDERWQPATAALRAARLNAPDDPVPRWAAEATVTALTAEGEPLEEPGRYDQDSGAAPPPPSPASTRTWRPWHWRGRPQVRRRRR